MLFRSARALKCEGERVAEPGALAAALARGFACDGPYLIDALIDPDAAAPIVGLDRPIAAGASH